MPTKIVVPALGESVVEATVARWLKKEGDPVSAGETIVELETDKVNLEVGTEKSGVLARIEKQSGEDVKVGDTLAVVEEGVATQAAAHPAEQQKAATPQAAAPPREPMAPAVTKSTAAAPARVKATPSARKMAQELGVALDQVAGSGTGNQITRQDVETHAATQSTPSAAPPSLRPAPKTTLQFPASPAIMAESEGRKEERIRMSRRRQTIAKRLLEAQHNAAMLTTYNEADMYAVMDLRKRHKESFQKRHGVGLGLTSFFVKAAIGALKAFPMINAEIQEQEIIYKKYYDIGIAIGAEEGLVVPVLRNADQLSFAEIEQSVKDFVHRSDEGTLTLEDLRGGTFTITNGGVFGSLMSTPILNPPQVAILGLHKIEERPVALNGQVVIRPMMYLALSYDHRVVDGRESVQFLARIKALIEEPAALLLED